MPTDSVFFSHLRTGLSTAISEPANEFGLPSSGATSVSAFVDVSGLARIPRYDATMRGSGDVLGLDPGAVRAVEPVPGSRDCELNFFPYVEFSDPALPWMFTPAAQSDNERLAPWMVLVALRKSPDVGLRPAASGRGKVLGIAKDAETVLPKLTEAHAWAHVENLTPDTDPATAHQAGNLISRILCPVNLAPNAAYIAALVPVFEAGRLAGLGREGIEAAGASLAWSDGTDALDLPVYHSWEFSTGATDFEELVCHLSPHEVSATTGLHDLDLSRPRGGLDLPLIGDSNIGSKQAIVSYRGALLSPRAEPKAWPGKHRTPFQNALRSILLAPSEPAKPEAGYDALRDDPAITAPVYGAWSHDKAMLDDPDMVWMKETNLTPFNRAVAGLGTETIRKDQESLVARAWVAAKGAREVQAHLRRSRLALSSARRVHSRLSKLRNSDLLQVSERLHGAITVADGPMSGHLTHTNAIANGVISATFRRLARQTTARLSDQIRANTPEIARDVTLACLSGAAAQVTDQLVAIDLDVFNVGILGAQASNLSLGATFEVLAEEMGFEVLKNGGCQSAFKADPLSAPNIDPLDVEQVSLFPN